MVSAAERPPAPHLPVLQCVSTRRFSNGTPLSLSACCTALTPKLPMRLLSSTSSRSMVSAALTNAWEGGEEGGEEGRVGGGEGGVRDSRKWSCSVQCTHTCRHWCAAEVMVRPSHGVPAMSPNRIREVNTKSILRETENKLNSLHATVLITQDLFPLPKQQSQRWLHQLQQPSGTAAAACQQRQTG